eukprot:m.422763 g.422763  ORF g.422763 m.422763 type:complete len:67 (-) comp38715_c0_seq1:89-289(-)
MLQILNRAPLSRVRVSKWSAPCTSVPLTGLVQVLQTLGAAPVSGVPATVKPARVFTVRFAGLQYGE